MTDDTRNVVDRYKGVLHEEIVADLDASGTGLEIAVENTERDFNMGTIVRSANAFGVRHVHVIGRRQWNKRGAMATDKYLHVHYYPTVAEFAAAMAERGREIVAVDNIEGSTPLAQTKLPKNAVLVFGQEGPGISSELVNAAKHIVAIEQFGSTRSINVGVAAGITMYEWLRSTKRLSEQ
jgi:tRNA G18 (ribose-2'-O)-methylase SpoU